MTIRLIHVGVQESNARRFLSNEKVPAWVESGEHEGNFAFLPWAEDQAMVLVTVQMAGDQHIVRVTVAALYEFVDGDAVPAEHDDIRAFYHDHMAELLPFVRQAVHAASSQVWPVRPIMLDVLAATPEEAAART